MPEPLILDSHGSIRQSQQDVLSGEQNKADAWGRNMFCNEGHIRESENEGDFFP